MLIQTPIISLCMLVVRVPWIPA